MMAHKQMLHELLKEDQEPFQLKSYIADRRSQIKKWSPKTSLQIKKRIENPRKPTTNNLCHHAACFLPFKTPRDVTNSPFIGFTPPAMSPCKSPVFLHVPTRTAAVLSEAAVRIEKQRKPKSQVKNVGFGLFGSFVKRLKDRSKNKKLNGLGNNVNEVEEKKKFDGDFRISCSCDLEASSRGREELDEINGDFTFRETRFCVSPFVFSLHRSPSSSSGCRTPEFCSPAASPSRHVNQEKEGNATSDLNKVQGEEEDKEQCSPVSVLDPFFEDEGQASLDAEDEEEEENDYDLECSFANVQRAKEQLLFRLRRFEQLAELDPMELEKKLLEASDDECQQESVGSEDDDYKKELVDTAVSLQDDHPTKLSTDLNPITEDKSKIICSKTKEVVCGRICNRSDLFIKEIKFNTIDTMIELDAKRDCEGWKNFTDQVEETGAEIEVAIFGLLVEEITEELFYNGEH